MPHAVIEYKDGNKKEYSFLGNGNYLAMYKCAELLEEEGHLASRIYTLDCENDLNDIFKWE